MYPVRSFSTGHDRSIVTLRGLTYLLCIAIPWDVISHSMYSAAVLITTLPYDIQCYVELWSRLIADEVSCQWSREAWQRPLKRRCIYRCVTMPTTWNMPHIFSYMSKVHCRQIKDQLSNASVMAMISLLTITAVQVSIILHSRFARCCTLTCNRVCHCCWALWYWTKSKLIRHTID